MRQKYSLAKNTTVFQGCSDRLEVSWEESE